MAAKLLALEETSPGRPAAQGCVRDVRREARPQRKRMTAEIRLLIERGEGWATSRRCGLPACSELARRGRPYGIAPNAPFSRPDRVVGEERLEHGHSRGAELRVDLERTVHAWRLAFAIPHGCSTSNGRG